MTTLSDRTAETTATGTGRVVRVIGPVVDVEFGRDTIPEQFNALTAEIELGELSKTLTLEVAQHIGDDMVRAIALQPTDGLVRGVAVTDTGSPIKVPVGNVTLGHVFNALGKPLDVSEDSSTSRSAGRSTASRRPSTTSSPRPRCSPPASR